MIDLRGVPHVVILGGMAAICLGVPISLYAIFTVDQRRATRAIQRGASERGWRYRSRSGGFRIEGSTATTSAPGNVAWVMTSGNSRESEMRWSCELNLRFPSLGGETDVAVLPRDGRPLLKAALSPDVEGRVAKFSGTLAGATRFLRDAHEVRSGVAGNEQDPPVYLNQDRRPYRFNRIVSCASRARVPCWPSVFATPFITGQCSE